MSKSDYTPAVDKRILSAMKKKGALRKKALEKISATTKVKYNTLLSRGFALAAKKNKGKKTLMRDNSGSMTATTTQVRVKYKSVSVDLASNELVFTI